MPRNGGKTYINLNDGSNREGIVMRREFAEESAEELFHRRLATLMSELDEQRREQAFLFLANLIAFIHTQVGGAGSVPIPPGTVATTSALCPRCGRTITLLR
jgi:hypothetical protein